MLGINIKSNPICVSTFASCTRPSTDQSLQKSFHLSHSDKIELKKISSPSENKKYANAQTYTTKIVKLNNDNGIQTRWTRTPAANSRFAKAGVSCFYDSEMLNPSFVHLMKFSA